MLRSRGRFSKKVRIGVAGWILRGSGYGVVRVYKRRGRVKVVSEVGLVRGSELRK